jgi:hypothetical protein
MSLNKPPSDAILARAAELRVTNATWEAIADEVGRAARTVRRWPLKYPERWCAALAQAERFMSAQADCESVHTLRRLLISEDEKIRWHAAKALIRSEPPLRSEPPRGEEIEAAWYDAEGGSLCQSTTGAGLMQACSTTFIKPGRSRSSPR